MKVRMSKKNLVKHLREDEFVTITFIKKDKTVRVMKATLLPQVLVGYDFKKTEKKDEKTDDENNPFLTVWDLEKEAWRTINFDTITETKMSYE